MIARVLSIGAVSACSVFATVLTQTGQQSDSGDRASALEGRLSAAESAIKATNQSILKLEERIEQLERDRAASARSPTTQAMGFQDASRAFEVFGGKVFSVRRSNSDYDGELQNHWVKESIGNGKFIILEDDSMWEIDDFDMFDTSMWVTATKVVILPVTGLRMTMYKLVSVRDDKRVWATFRGYVSIPR